MAKTKYIQGIYQPENMYKYVGKTLPKYRSGWEKKVFIYLDKNPSVISWASEAVKIPYINPFKPIDSYGRPKVSHYIPDLLVTTINKMGQEVTEMIEIKPSSEALEECAKSKKNKEAFAVNSSKWEQAAKWCEYHRIGFRILTEKDLFGK